MSPQLSGTPSSGASTVPDFSRLHGPEFVRLIGDDFVTCRAELERQVAAQLNAAPDLDILIRPAGSEFLVVSLRTLLRFLTLADLRQCLAKHPVQAFEFIAGHLDLKRPGILLGLDHQGSRRLVFEDGAPDDFVNVHCGLQSVASVGDCKVRAGSEPARTTITTPERESLQAPAASTDAMKGDSQ